MAFEELRWSAGLWFFGGILIEAAYLALPWTARRLLGLLAGCVAGALAFAIGWGQFDDVVTTLLLSAGASAFAFVAAFGRQSNVPGDEHVLLSLLVSLWGWLLGPGSPMRPEGIAAYPWLAALLGLATAWAVFSCLKTGDPGRRLRAAAHFLQMTTACVLMFGLCWTARLGFFFDELPGRLPAWPVGIFAGVGSMYLSIYAMRLLMTLNELWEGSWHDREETYQEVADSFRTDRLPPREAVLIIGLQGGALAANGFLNLIPHALLFALSVVVAPQVIVWRARPSALGGRPAADPKTL